MNSKTRSFVKGVTWRFLATLTTMILVYIFTGDLSLTLGIGILEVTAKIILYYLHERAWENVTWGKN